MVRRKLKVSLPQGWQPSPQSQAIGRPAFVRVTSQSPGLLQIHSQIFYRRGPVPNPTAQDLVELATHAAQAEGVAISETASGPCQLGLFGTAIGPCPGHARAQVWAVSNGQDIFVLSHSSVQPPESAEVADSQSVIDTLSVTASERPWWQFW